MIKGNRIGLGNFGLLKRRLVMIKERKKTLRILLIILGAVVVFATYTVRESRRDDLRMTIDAVDAARSIFLVRRQNAEIVRNLGDVANEVKSLQEAYFLRKGLLPENDVLVRQQIFIGQIDLLMSASDADQSVKIATEFTEKIPKTDKRTSLQKDLEGLQDLTKKLQGSVKDWTENLDREQKAISNLDSKEVLEDVVRTTPGAATNEAIRRQLAELGAVDKKGIADLIHEIEARRNRLWFELRALNEKIGAYQESILSLANDDLISSKHDYERYKKTSNVLYAIGCVISALAALSGVETEIELRD